MTSWVEDSLELARRSNGAFDPTIGRLTRLWNIEGDNPKVPSKQEVKNTLKDTGYTKIHLEKVETQNTAITKKNVDKDIKDNTDKNGDAAKDTDNNTINSTAQNTAVLSGVLLASLFTMLSAVFWAVLFKTTKRSKRSGHRRWRQHPLIWKKGRRNQLECCCTKSKRQGWRSNGSPVPLWYNQRFHIRRLRKVLHAKRKKIPPHPRSFNRLSSRKQSDFCNSSKRQRLTLQRR